MTEKKFKTIFHMLIEKLQVISGWSISVLKNDKKKGEKSERAERKGSSQAVNMVLTGDQI